MIKRALFLCFLLGLAGLISAHTAWAHALLLRSDPPANASLPAAPQEIRLWFSEPLEAQFSSVELRDSDGQRFQKLQPQPDPADEQQLVAPLEELPNGLYTVTWRVVSRLDGHTTHGSFVFGVGVPVTSAPTEIRESIPADSVLIRWINLLALAAGMGGIGFGLLVWQPAAPQSHPQIEARMRRLIWAGWLLIGGAGVLVLLLQVKAAADVSLWEAFSAPALQQTITETYFGRLWLARLGLWLVMGATLQKRAGLALLAGGGIILTHSLFSHAHSSADQTAALAADWLHTTAMALWLGGLLQFLNVLSGIRHFEPAFLGILVGYFSNSARVLVAMLILTGVYAAWLHVGSLDGLLETAYGQALLIKLILLLPLLGLAGVNLLITSKRLAAGQLVWAGRLRGLVGAEIVLLIGILAAVGVMTAIAPSRSTLAARAALPAAPEPTPIQAAEQAGDLQLELEITPGWVGENTFILRLSDQAGELISDATLVRLRFDYIQQDIGQSDLSLSPQAAGIYSAEGANLSLAGDWRIRVTIQRPNLYDTVVDFAPNVASLPPPPPPKFVDTRLPIHERRLALLLVGLGGLGIGVFFLSRQPIKWHLAALISALLIGVSGVLAISGAVLEDKKEAAAQVYQAAPEAPIKVALLRDSELPVLIRADGTLWQPNSDGQWRLVQTPAKVRDLYADTIGQWWAATDAGLYLYAEGEWQNINSQPVHRLMETHGYLYALGDREIIRLEPAKAVVKDLRLLNVPVGSQPAANLVMLGNHSHVLQMGDAVYLTPDLGLSWQPLSAPYPVVAVEIDPAGNLIASTEKGLLRWATAEQAWSNLPSLPEGRAAVDLQVFNNRVYALAQGRLYRREADTWGAIDFPEDAYLIDMVFQYPASLWVLDAAGARLWRTQDGENWMLIPIETVEPADS